MHHRRGNKGKGVLSETEGVTLPRHYAVVREIGAEKLLHHRKRLGCRDNGCFGVQLHKIKYIRRMVGLHMLNNKIIGRSAVKNGIDIVKPLMRKARVHRIYNSGLFICNSV